VLWQVVGARRERERSLLAAPTLLRLFRCGKSQEHPNNVDAPVTAPYGHRACAAVAAAGRKLAARAMACCCSRPLLLLLLLLLLALLAAAELLLPG